MKELEHAYENISLVSKILYPLFLEDPKTGSATKLFETIRNTDNADFVREWPYGDDVAVLSAILLMKEALVGGVSEDVIWDYRRLFIGPSPKPCPPWGSVYTDHEMVIFGESMLDLRQWMRENNIEKKTEENEPEDHIGKMLALLGIVAKEKPELVAEYLEKHLLTWAYHYLEQLRDAAETSFYQGLAVLTLTTLKGIQNDLEIEVEYPHYYR